MVTNIKLDLATRILFVHVEREILYFRVVLTARLHTGNISSKFILYNLKMKTTTKNSLS